MLHNFPAFLKCEAGSLIPTGAQNKGLECVAAADGVLFFPCAMQLVRVMTDACVTVGGGGRGVVEAWGHPPPVTLPPWLAVI